MNKDYYVVIMAGGVGTRFWPMSVSACPKQFIDVMGTGRTMIQQTFDRFKDFCPVENVFVVTGEAYRELVLKQLPELKPDRVLCEPHRKNTAPCIAYANYRIHAINPNAIVVVTPADHVVLKQDIFNSVIHQAADAASANDWLITLGIKPSYPNTGYGYIQFDPDEAWIQNPAIKRVKLFTEKPGLEMARTFVQSGEFLWNAGIFIWSLKSSMQSFKMYLPEVDELFAGGVRMYGTSLEKDYIEKYRSLISDELKESIYVKAYSMLFPAAIALGKNEFVSEAKAYLKGKRIPLVRRALLSLSGFPLTVSFLEFLYRCRGYFV